MRSLRGHHLQSLLLTIEGLEIGIRMLDQSLIQKIKSVAQGETELSPGEMQPLAREFDEAARAALKRLDEIHDLLARGQRAQAIHLAETPPPLLDVVGALDFPGIESWKSFAAGNGLPVPPEFPSPKIQALEEAYAQQDALEPLQAVYRRLCLQRGSTRDKLVALRRIRNLDSANPAWSQDVQALEAQRFREIRQRLASDRDRISESEAQNMHQELTDSKLLCRPPIGLDQQAAAFVEQLKVRRVHGTMTSLTRIINTAYGAMDYPAASRTLDQLDDLSKKEGVTIPAALQTAVDEARAWREERKQEEKKRRSFEHDVAELQRLLEKDAEAKEIGPLLRKVEAYDMDVPGGLRERALTYLAELESQEQERKKAIRLAVAAGIVLAVLLVAGAAWFVVGARRSQALAKAILSYVESKDFPGARKFVENARTHSPGLLQAGEVLSAIRELEKRELEEKNRAAQFASALRQAEQMDPLDAGLPHALERALMYARTVEEKDSVKALEARAASASARRSQERATQASQLHTECSKVYKNLQNNSDPDAMGPLIGRLDDLSRQAEIIPGLSAEMRDLISGYRKRVESERGRADQIREQQTKERARLQRAQQTLASARTKLPDVGDYLAVLWAARDEFADVPEFQNLPRWEALAAEYVAVATLGASLDKPGKKRAGGPFVLLPPYTDFKRSLEGYQDKAPEIFAMSLAIERKRVGYLSEGPARLQKLVDVFKHDLMSRLYEFTTENRKTGERLVYYTKPDEKRLEVADGRVQLRYFVDENMNLFKPRVWDLNEFAVSDIRRSPHCQLAEDVRKQLQDETISPDWTPRLPGVLLSLIKARDAHPDLNAWAEAFLIQKVVQFDVENTGCLGLTESLQKRVKKLLEKPIQFWIPENEEVRYQLKVVAKGIDDLRPDLEKHLGTLLEPGGKAMLEQAALARPLVISGTIAAAGDDGGRPNVMPLRKEGYAEYWVIVETPQGKRFEIAALQKASGEPEWLTPDHLPLPGMPLLSPADGMETLKFLELLTGVQEIQEGLEGWPINLRAVAVSSKQ